MGPQTVAKLGLPLQQGSPPSESPQVGWQQVSWLQLALMPQQEPEAHWSPAVQMAPKPPVLPEELPLLEELPEWEVLVDALELFPSELELLPLEELAALVELALVPEELPVLAALLVLVLVLALVLALLALELALELDEAPLLALDDETPVLNPLVLPPQGTSAGWQKLSAAQQIVPAISVQSPFAPHS